MKVGSLRIKLAMILTEITGDKYPPENIGYSASSIENKY